MGKLAQIDQNYSTGEEDPACGLGWFEAYQLVHNVQASERVMMPAGE